MILIFDLDDTLYDEMSYVMSGLHAVARFGDTSYGWDAEQSFSFMQTYLLQQGRGRVFDAWLSQYGRFSGSRVATCVSVYRHHRPDIQLFPTARAILQRYRWQCPLYLVTDGHKVAQQQKVEALNLNQIFQRVFITHRFGIRNAKPSLHCFDIIRRSQRCEWSEMVYVGDNPAKDFVNLNAVGAFTVRVRTGSHATAIAHTKEHDAKIKIPDLTSLPAVLDQWRVKQ